MFKILGFTYRSRALKSRSKLRAATGLRAAIENFLLHENLSLFTETFGEKVPTLAKSRGSFKCAATVLDIQANLPEASPLSICRNGSAEQLLSSVYITWDV